MESMKDKERRKQPYQKPRLRTIELAAEEVLVFGCKDRFIGGWDIFDQPLCGVAAGCNQHGS
ncbi:MAG: hypothetical protein GY849_24725 [Deltaproteobacteria bacterium]|nr:hypothetical protein [Deltaproteobacteria bacterium]